ASCSLDGTALIWDFRPKWNGKAMATLTHANEKGAKVPVHCVAYSPRGDRVATGAADGLVRQWSVRGGPPLAVHGAAVAGPTHGVLAVAFLPDGQALVSGSDDGTLTVWDLVKNAPRLTIRAHAKAVTSVAVSRDGKRLLSGSRDMTVRLWDAATGAEVTDFVAA